MQCFKNDVDQLEDFLNSLTDHELSIITQSNDPNIIIRMKTEIQNDLNDTAKALCMEE